MLRENTNNKTIKQYSRDGSKREMKKNDEVWLITVFKQKSGDKTTVVKLRFTE